jgi:hypothetical protein
LRLQVAGEGREELLARALPEGFTPTSIASALPARLEADGRLRVQVRPGSYEIVLGARGASVATALKRPPLAPAGATWPRDEIWSFAGDDRLRIAAAEGPESMDPKQANVPPGWQGLPAYRMTADATLTVKETSRGLGAGDDNRLQLNRNLWLDFSHEGLTAVDSIRGSLRRDWRLDMAAPFTLASVRSGEENLLVTNTPGTDAKEGARTGVELRTPSVELATIARSAASSGALPASGWTTRFEQVQGQLFLPPGHRLLAAIGPDFAPGTWWSRWTLWNIFGLCIVVAVTYRLAGRIVAGIALIALALMYQESPEMIWLWANLLAAIAIARAVPEGRLRRVAGTYRMLSIVVLGLALLPMLWTQVRYALYPQLENTALFDLSFGGGRRDVGTLGVELAPAAAPPMNAPEAKLEDVVVTGARLAAKEEELSVAQQPQKSAEYLSRGLNAVQVVQRYAPGTQLQTGPGIPAWSYNTYQYGWSGPVEPGDSVHFIYIGPFLLSLWRLLGVVALAAWFIALLQKGFGLPLRAPWPGGRVIASALPFIGCGLLSALALVAAPTARAASTPDTALLNELRTRLTEAPQCAPTCAEITAARVSVATGTLEVEMSVSALTTIAVPLPQAGDRWQIDSVSVDGASSLALRRTDDNAVWLPLRSGTHSVRLSGHVAPVDTLQLAFPQPPRTISVVANGWTAAGVVDGRLASGSLELTRVRTAAAGGSAAASRMAETEFPPFVQVTRDIVFDTDWSVTTYVIRLAPARAAINVAIPLIAGESVLSAGIHVTPQKTVLAALASGDGAIGWNSGLPRSAALELTLPENPSRVEVWTFHVSPQWHVEFEGLPAVSPESIDPANWSFQYYPRPGEKLSLRISRPQPAAGATLAIDQVRQMLRVGARSSDAQLDFAYRSTEGGRHAITLPADVRVQSVSVDGTVIPLRPEQGVLSIGLLPGSHRVTVNWQSPRGTSIAGTADAVDLGSAASNVTTALQLPEDRWALFALGRGAGVGPAVLYWGELVLFLVVATLLGRWRHSPLRVHEWLLLGLGLSTLSWFVFALVAVWLFAFRWRAQRAPESLSRWRFNILQIALAALAIVAITSLVFSGIRYGFLASPDMGVVGADSGYGAFSWFRDQTSGPLPQPLVISVPLWVYKALIFAWAMWIAVALTRWIRAAWAGWTHGGYWRGKALLSAAPDAPVA